ncbi:IS4 family transposase, partial [Paraburkholderia mimosarum]
FLARKGDGEPGAKTIWEGLQRVITAAEAIRALRSEGALA